MDALVFQEIFHFYQVHPHVNHLLQESFPALGEEIFALLVTSK